MYTTLAFTYRRYGRPTLATVGLFVIVLGPACVNGHKGHFYQAL